MTRHHSLRRLFLVLSAVLLVCGASRQAAAQSGAKDPALGSWQLDMAKSTFSVNRPEQRTLTFELTAGGAIREIARTRQANGATDTVEYTAKEDGKDYPISNSVLDTVSLKRLDARSVERRGKVRGQVVETRTRTVSPDGKTLTIKTEGTNNGVRYSSTQVFQRVESAGN
jgi:hypothetical protein